MEEKREMVKNQINMNPQIVSNFILFNKQKSSMIIYIFIY